MPAPIILYDGVCGLCNRFVQFILRQDRKAVFRFASLQSSLAGEILSRHGLDGKDLNTVYLILDPGTAGEQILFRSGAVLEILQQLGGVWRPISFALQLFPPSLRNIAYGGIARRRYQIFGRADSCILPSARHRDRFLDL
jgi:predicted DCC family thiol-disulfide oxidoreductase YuxK